MTDRFEFNDKTTRFDFLPEASKHDMTVDELFADMERDLAKKDKALNREELPEGWLRLAGTKTPKVERRWIVEDVIPDGEITLLAARGGMGKTSVMLNLAGAIHRKDATWGGKRIDPEADHLTLLTAGEQAEPQLHQLAELVGAGDSDDQHQWLHFNLVEMSLVGEDFWRMAKETRKVLPRSIFMIDSASSCLKGDSTDRENVTDHFTRLRDIGGPWVVLHHMNKDREAKGADQVAGSTAWIDRCDRLILLTETSDGAAHLLCDRRGERVKLTVPVPHLKPQQITPGRPS